MRLTLLSEYGIKNPVIAVSNGMIVRLKEYQTPLIDKPFTCPISKDVWKSIELHNARCKYKYCKGRWNFRYV